MRNRRRSRWASSRCAASPRAWHANCRRRASTSRISSSQAAFAALFAKKTRNGRIRRWIPTRSRKDIGAYCSSRAAPGACSWKCGRGWRSFEASPSFRGARSANPESRDSGFDASHRPGMTKEMKKAGLNMTLETTIDTGTDELLCVIRDRVAVITLNRPEARNALSDHLTPALRTMIRTCGENPDVGVLLITGAGTAFCSGGDIKGMGAHRDKKKMEMSYDEKVADLQERQRLLTGALVSVRKPTIAALPGPAAGAGLAIAMACDIRIAAASAFVSTGYLRVALSGDYGIAWLLTRLVGTARARELMFTADKVDAARCEQIGLVNRVVPDDKLQEEAFALAKSMAEGPTLALRYMKDNLDEALLFDFSTARDHEAERLIRLTMTADHREAVQAFIEKRKAVFKGN